MTHLSQRGRAGLQFLGSLQPYSSSRIRGIAKSEFESDSEGADIISQHEAGGSNEPWSERIARAKAVAARSTAYKHERFYQRYVAEENFVRAIPAVEEKRSEFEEMLAKREFTDCGESLELDESIPIPEYYDGVEWHLQPGGWDGYDLSGPMYMAGVVPYVFRRGGYAAVEVSDKLQIHDHRVEVTNYLPKDHYDVIYEMGCGGSATLAACHKNYPDAKLVGCDLSKAMLQGGHDAARAMGVPIHFKQRDARDTGEPDESVDAVLLYAVFHEMPVSVCRQTLEEAFRILKPGGDILINDPPPFAQIHPFQAVVLAWENDNRGEPYFFETCATEWVDVMEEIGFVNTSAFGLGANGYPWVNLGSKPTLNETGERKVTKPPPNPITGSEEMDALMRINTELMSELWILRDRVTILEKLLEQKGVVTRQAIDDFILDDDFAKELNEERDKYVRRVAGAPWEVEFTVESLVQNGQR